MVNANDNSGNEKPRTKMIPSIHRGQDAIVYPHGDTSRPGKIVKVTNVHTTPDGEPLVDAIEYPLHGGVFTGPIKGIPHVNSDVAAGGEFERIRNVGLWDTIDNAAAREQAQRKPKPLVDHVGMAESVAEEGEIEEETRREQRKREGIDIATQMLTEGKDVEEVAKFVANRGVKRAEVEQIADQVQAVKV